MNTYDPLAVPYDQPVPYHTGPFPHRSVTPRIWTKFILWSTVFLRIISWGCKFPTFTGCCMSIWLIYFQGSLPALPALEPSYVFQRSPALYHILFPFRVALSHELNNDVDEVYTMLQDEVMTLLEGTETYLRILEEIQDAISTVSNMAPAFVNCHNTLVDIVESTNPQSKNCLDMRDQVFTCIAELQRYVASRDVVRHKLQHTLIPTLDAGITEIEVWQEYRRNATQAEMLTLSHYWEEIRRTLPWRNGFAEMQDDADRSEGLQKERIKKNRRIAREQLSHLKLLRSAANIERQGLQGSYHRVGSIMKDAGCTESISLCRCDNVNLTKMKIELGGIVADISKL